MKQNKFLIVSALIVLVGLMSSISAFGVSSPYWEDKPLVLDRGETTVVGLNLQNMVGEDDVTVSAGITKGSEISSLEKNEYSVPIGTSQDVPVKISIPRDIAPGTETEVAVTFKTVNTQSGGVAMGTGMVISFKVIAGEEEAPKSKTWIYLLVIAVLLVAIVVVKRMLSCKKRK